MDNVKVLKYDKAELVGATKEEAFAMAPFFIQGDATQAYKNWEKKQTGVITNQMKDDFYLAYLKQKSKCAPGTGFAITTQSAVEDSRQRPYTVHDQKNKKGKRKYKTTYEIIDNVTGEVIAMSQETKAKALQIAKDLYAKNGLKHDVTCRYSHQVVEGEPIAFKIEYTPSKNTRAGKYIVFGVRA